MGWGGILYFEIYQKSAQSNVRLDNKKQKFVNFQGLSTIQGLQDRESQNNII